MVIYTILVQSLCKLQANLCLNVETEKYPLFFSFIKYLLAEYKSEK